ncbi:MAG: hypothetical protein IKP92_05270 [Lachnospiraceae bacterium]|nr:hypothetical protein [Lachnospiraceae bacterium]
MAREKKKKRVVNPHYKFTNKTVPMIVIFGLSLGIMSLAALIMTIVLTFTRGGVAPFNYGITALVAFLFSAFGLFCCIRGRLMPDTYVFFSTLGMGICGINIFFVIYILGRGILSL